MIYKFMSKEFFPQRANVTPGISFLNVLIKGYKMTAVQECRAYEALYLV